MALQARAEATRRRILDTAIDLFDEMGYGDTGLADVLQRANASKGAFYYHFDSKEALATAIIDESRRRITDAAREKVDPSAPLLDRIIIGTFLSIAMLQSDKGARIANQLLQGLSQISSTASQVYGESTTEFLGAVTAGLQAVGLRDGVDAAEVAEATWAGVLGSHLLCSAIDSDPYTRLACTWRSALRAALPDELLGRYQDLIDSIAAQYQTVG